MRTFDYLLPRNEGRMKKLLLWDLDGTLSDDRQRQHFYQTKQWEKYFSYQAQMSDPVFPAARALYDELKSSGWDMGYLSARLERNRQASHDWLKLNNFDRPDKLMLRPEELSDMRPPQFKAGVLKKLIESNEYDCVMLVDNDPHVVNFIRKVLGDEHIFFADWGSEHTASSVTEAVAETA